jgi:Spy/CpxP family protein refolding chaperone
MKKNLVLLTAVIMLLAPLAMAQPGGRGDEMGMGKGMGKGRGMGMGTCRQDCMMSGDCMRPGMMLKMADEIGLDAGQKAQISKMTEEFGIARIDKVAELEKAELRLRNLMQNDGADKEILAAMDKVGTLKTEMKKMRFQHQRQVKAILNADQLKKLKELMPKMDRGEGRGMGRGHGCNMEKTGGLSTEEGDGPAMGWGCSRPCGMR